MAQLEIACFDAESAHVAQAAGADRIELCADRLLGGVTPSLETLVSIKATLTAEGVLTPIFIMIRPRGGNFLYSDLELDVMELSIRSFADASADGFVFGILTSDGEIDVPRNQRLVHMARGRPCTFHRAFDGVPDFDRALESVIECGFSNILTAGSTDEIGALAGIHIIRTLVEKAKCRVSIIPGGGVRSGNVSVLRETTGAEWYHSSAILPGEALANGDEVRKLRQNAGGKN